MAGVIAAFSLSHFPDSSVMASEGETAYDRIWSHATLYENPAGLVQSLALSGRLQADSVWFEADQGEFSDLQWRRFRFGFKAKLAGNWVAHLEGDFDLNESLGEMYDRLTDAYIGWQPSDSLSVKILKQGAGFTLDGETSSKKLLTPERNNLTNNLWFTAEYFTGVSLAGQTDKRWSYKVGIFSTDGDDELSSFDASFFTLASLGYHWAEALNMKNAEIRLDYVHNDENINNNTPDFSKIMSLTTKWEKNRWGLWTDLATGKGYFDQSDIWGVSLMPFYNISELVQLVFRYTHLSSDDENGLRLERYEDDIVGGRGDRYDAFYGGVNVFFYGHKLKWQTGLEHARMRDNANDGGNYDGWGLTTSLRISW